MFENCHNEKRKKKPILIGGSRDRRCFFLSVIQKAKEAKNKIPVYPFVLRKNPVRVTILQVDHVTDFLLMQEEVQAL